MTRLWQPAAAAGICAWSYFLFQDMNSLRNEWIERRGAESSAEIRVFGFLPFGSTDEVKKKLNKRDQSSIKDEES